MKKQQNGFTLIELMTVIAIIGILAAVALPAYQDYTSRARSSEVVLAASSVKQNIAEFAQVNDTLTNSGTGLAIATAGSMISSASVTANGVISIVGADSNIGSAITIVLTPTLGSSNVVTWACTSPIGTSIAPSSCR